MLITAIISVLFLLLSVLPSGVIYPVINLIQTTPTTVINAGLSAMNSATQTFSVNLSSIPFVTITPPVIVVNYSSWNTIMNTNLNVSLVSPVPNMFSSFSFNPALETMIFG
jgi:hypothetical protein